MTAPSSLALALRRALVARKDAAGFDRLSARVAEAIGELAKGVNAGILTADAWQAEMANLLLAGHLAAYAAGRDVAPRALTPDEERRVAEIVAGQIPYLDAFATQVDADGWQAAMDARAQMYGRAMRQSYERGRARGLPLPAVPGDGSTECLSNCRCAWRIRWIDRAAGDVDCHWELGKAEHCDDCRDRARRWSPLRIRGWEVMK